MLYKSGLKSAKQVTIPVSSIIYDNSFGTVNYADSFKILIPQNYDSVDKLVLKTFNRVPDWIKFLLTVRNIIVKPFGLKTNNGSSEGIPESNLKEGDKIKFFTVLKRNQDEIVLYGNDTHLNFRTSILKEDTDDGNYLYSSTIVKYNNMLGRTYFFFVKPFHKIIIQSMLRNLLSSH